MAKLEFSEIIHEYFVESLSNNSLTILARDDFSNMLQAATLSAPSHLIQPQELLAPAGSIFFETEQMFDGVFDLDQPFRAVSWTTEDSTLAVFLWCEGHHRTQKWAQLTENMPAPPELGYALNVCGVSFTPLNTSLHKKAITKKAERHTPMVGLIRAIAAVAKSEATRQTTVSPETKSERKKREREQRQQKSSAQNKRQAPSIRVLSLVNPEHGRYELEAATGRHQRQHWVRGHWRNQWYPSTQEHRVLWIDGFIKGDAALGTLTQPKIYVTPGNKTTSLLTTLHTPQNRETS